MAGGLFAVGCGLVAESAEPLWSNASRTFDSVLICAVQLFHLHYLAGSLFLSRRPFTAWQGLATLIYDAIKAPSVLEYFVGHFLAMIFFAIVIAVTVATLIAGLQLRDERSPDKALQRPSLGSRAVTGDFCSRLCGRPGVSGGGR
jgi:hypothetical protein